MCDGGGDGFEGGFDFEGLAGGGFHGGGGVFEAATGADGEHAVVGIDDAALDGALDAGDAGGGGWFGEDAMAAELGDGGEHFGVAHRDECAFAIADGAGGFDPIAGDRDVDAFGDGRAIDARRGFVVFVSVGDRGNGGGLDGEHPRESIDAAEGVHLGETLGDARNRAAVTYGDGNPIGRSAAGSALFGDLEAACLLAFDEDGIDRAVAVVPAEALAGGGAEFVGGVVVAGRREDASVEAERLGEFWGGGTLRDEDHGAQAGEGGVAGEAGGGVAGGGGGDGGRDLVRGRGRHRRRSRDL